MKAQYAERAAKLVESLKAIKEMIDYLDDDDNLEDVVISTYSDSVESIITDGQTGRALLPLLQRMTIQNLEDMGVEI